jgi:protease IV
MLAQALGDAKRIAAGGSVQARCLECTALGPVSSRPSDFTLLQLLLGTTK